MKVIKVLLNNNFIKYKKEHSYYHHCYIDEIDTKYLNKIERIIENKAKIGEITYIRNFPVKNWIRYGCNHYTTIINGKEFTFICKEEFGSSIPNDILEKLINDVYINIIKLDYKEVIEFYKKIGIKGYEIEFSSCYNREETIKYIALNHIKLCEILYDDINMSYGTFAIKKKKKGIRVIEAPNDELKNAQRIIIDLVLKNIIISPYAMAFRENKSIIENAKKHLNKKYVLNIDLKDFFNSIKSYRVYNIFRENKIPHNEAAKLTKLCTHKGHLPQGAPSSPFISNIICSELDKRLSLLCKTIKADYTRYADDITISSNNADIKNIRNSIENIIKEEGFDINYEKLRLLSKNTKQVVTGLIVNEKLNIDKKYVRKIRQELYYCKKFGIKQHLIFNGIKSSEAKYLEELRGKVSFIKSVNYNLGAKLYKDLQILSTSIEKEE